MPDRVIKYTEAIREATSQLLERDPDVFVIGEGVAYPNGADGTTAGLKSNYPNRVLDVPLSEDAFSGLAVGAAISGLKPIVHHGRVEFSLFAADQIITQAAKWNYMFGGGNPVSVVFRICIGRKWGDGPQHTQSLYGLFGSATGLKVVIPSTPAMAKGLLIAAVKDPNPVVYLEPRWLYSIKEHVSESFYSEPLDKARVVRRGRDVTVVAYGDGLVETLEACEIIGKRVSIEVIDVVSINPVDHATILKSVARTGRLVCVETAPSAFSISSEIIAGVTKSISLKQHPIVVSCPGVPCPTSTALIEAYYPTKVDIANAILRSVGIAAIKRKLSFAEVQLAPTHTII